MDFAQGVRAIMARERCSQAELCRKAGLDPSWLSQLLSGKITNPSLDKAALVAEALEVSLDALCAEALAAEDRPRRARNQPVLVSNERDIELYEALLELGQFDREVVRNIALALASALSARSKGRY